VAWATVAPVRRGRGSFPEWTKGARRYLPLVVALVCLVVAASTTAASAAHGKHHRGPHHYRIRSTPATNPLRTAIFDPFLMPGWEQDDAFHLLRAAGGSYVRMLVRWSSIAPVTVPAGFDPTDPNSPGYSWATTDAAVSAARAAGLTPIVDVISPPAWATEPGTINPQITPLGQFATALATHYDGSHGAPAEHVFQVWNEPNLSLDLDPVDPAVYRSMVNAVAASVHAVNPNNLVVAGDLDPFANATNRFHTMAPMEFMRELLCLSSGKTPRRTCNATVNFDVWSHHPYTYQGAFGHAKSKDDISLGDLPRMNALLQAGVKLHAVVSSQPVQFWVTEFAWDTNPPRSHAVPLKLEARWTAEAFYQMWRSGVSLVTWFLLQDQPLKGATRFWQSGLYFYSPALTDAKAKPMRTSFRFPFVAYLGSKRVSIWGRDATSKKAVVTIQLRPRAHGRWKTVARVRSNRYGIFLGKLNVKGASQKGWMRAVAAGSGTSLPFALERPNPKLRYNPFGKG
jgi:Cellulase (glycosyl hydrolase family 5)